MYEGKVVHGKLDATTPVDVYWMDIEPSFQAENRKKGHVSDRSELIWLEKQMAYGITTTADAHKPGHYKLVLVSVPKREMEVFINASGHAECHADINGKRCRVTYVYVKSQERSWLPPKPVYVDMVGKDLSDGSEHRERTMA